MALLAFSVSVVALLVAVITLFGYSSLLAEIRRLQDFARVAMVEHRRFSELSGDGHCVVLVTEDGCFSCAERLREFADLAEPGRETLRYIVAHSGRVDSLIELPGSIRVVDDPQLIGRLGIGIMPSLIVADADGEELARTVVGDSQSLENIHLWAAERSRDRRAANDIGVRP